MSVYFAKVGKYVKVGWSTDPEHRIRSIRTAKIYKPSDLDVTAPVELLHVAWGGTRLDEMRAHQALQGCQASGEWFNDCAELRAYMASGEIEGLVLEREREFPGLAFRRKPHRRPRRRVA